MYNEEEINEDPAPVVNEGNEPAIRSPSFQQAGLFGTAPTEKSKPNVNVDDSFSGYESEEFSD